MIYWEDVKFVMKGGVLIPKNEKERIKYDNFLKNIKEDEEIEIFLNVKQKEKSLAQLAKIHACIREISLESGYTFGEIKNLVKINSGFVNPNGETKSFKDCGLEEGILIIQECIEIGKYFNLNLQ